MNDRNLYETTPSILNLDSSDPFMIDQAHNIIAAGPVHRLDCGVLSDRHKRVVLRINHEGSRYRVDFQGLKPNGEHDHFDGCGGRLFDVYKDAIKAFLEAQIEMHSFGYAHHDGDSDSHRLKLEVVPA